MEIGFQRDGFLEEIADLAQAFEISCVGHAQSFLKALSELSVVFWPIVRGRHHNSTGGWALDLTAGIYLHLNPEDLFECAYSQQ